MPNPPRSCCCCSDRLCRDNPSGRLANRHRCRKTPLDDYIAKPDPTYAWKLVKTIPGDGVTTFVLDLKSQTWRATPEVDRPVWQHWLTIVKPDEVKHDTAFLSIGGGRNGGQRPGRAQRSTIDSWPRRTSTVVADLGMVPNQPLVFNKDGKQRSEDDLIAYCHIKFMDTGDPTWLPRLPMVKSAVQAMDAATEFLGQRTGRQDRDQEVRRRRRIEARLDDLADRRRGPAGRRPSSRSSSTSSTSRPCMMNHYAAYGFWAPAVGDYTRSTRSSTAATRRSMPELLKIVDPYFYRDRLDAAEVHRQRRRRPVLPARLVEVLLRRPARASKYLRYVPNADHSLRGTPTPPTASWRSTRPILNGSPLPQVLLEDAGRRLDPRRDGGRSRRRSTSGRRPTPRRATSGW